MQRFIAGLLLLTFTFSITPKRFLHNTFAKHTDNKSQKNNSPYHFAVSGYDCDTDNLVAESNFESSQYSFELLSISYASFYHIKKFSFSSNPVLYSHLRGPPSNI